MALIYNATFDKSTRKLSFEDRAGNEIYSFTVPERGPSVDSVTKPLTFKATQDGSSVTLKQNGAPSGTFQTSRDGGKTWVDYTISSKITLNTGDEVSFRAKADRTSEQNGSYYFYFIMTGKIEAWHNVMSMYRTNDFATYDTVLNSAFCYLFQNCSSLTKAPVLPATTLAIHCCLYMFKGCTSLTKAPELPATTLVEDCYSNMFDGCTSLTEAPALPATTLDRFCYWEMFKGCTSLTKVPELPEATLGERCYNSMFNGCSSLNEVHCKMSSSYSSSGIVSYARDWLLNVSATGTFYTNADANWPSGASGIPTGWTRVNEGAPTVDDITKPLTFKATQDGSTVKLRTSGSPTGEFQTSRDGGNTWVDYTIGTSIALNTGDEVSFRAKADRTTGQTFDYYFYFEMTGKIEAWHNVMSLYRTSDFATYESVVKYAFYQLFSGCASLTKAPRLPATTLASDCYRNMFYGCTSLTEAPELPATTLADLCYYGMFYGCTSLTKAPVLPATTLASYCYRDMFNGCTSLVNAPVLPATTLASYCYYIMFQGCTSLTKAPELPATTLAELCYYGMFKGCTSLTKAPELTATTLVQHCYRDMFNGCSSLNEVRCQMPSTISAEDIPTYTGPGAYAWLNGVSATGTFYTNADANWPSGASGIPEGWTRIPKPAPATSDVTKPLTFRATQDGSTVTLKKNGTPTGDFQTSTDGGNTWVNYTLNTAIALNTGDEVSFRAKADRTSAQSDQNYFYFMMEGKIEAWHNVMSLYRTNDFATYESVVEYGFSRLFEGCTSLVKAPVLPATTLAPSCYRDMFNGCTSLTKAPELPATTLTSVCYSNMFYGCTSLVNAPALPATTLSFNCYDGMFNGCTSLVNAPVLPATTLVNYCYRDMFNGCTSLTKAPELPATTLTIRCYSNMFRGCTSLVNAPKLPATTLDASCYDSMFYGCTSLVNAPKLPATTLSAGCYVDMFCDCTSLKESPELPATTLPYRCYENMFYGCTSLANAPKLPATTLDENCYYGMFFGCTSLANAPALPATTLAVGCYQHMFEGCTSLTKAPALPATTLDSRCYQFMFGGCSWLNEVHCNMPSSYSSSTIEKTYAYSWLNGVSATGTFYTNADANWPSGASGIPEGWTRVNA